MARNAAEPDWIPADWFFPTRRASIMAQACDGCGQPALEFRDALSRTEYGISGLCQLCQDAAFSGDDWDDMDVPEGD